MKFWKLSVWEYNKDRDDYDTKQALQHLQGGPGPGVSAGVLHGAREAARDRARRDARGDWRVV